MKTGKRIMVGLMVMLLGAGAAPSASAEFHGSRSGGGWHGGGGGGWHGGGGGGWHGGPGWHGGGGGEWHGGGWRRGGWGSRGGWRGGWHGGYGWVSPYDSGYYYDGYDGGYPILPVPAYSGVVTAPAISLWYYCPPAQGYYPYIASCPTGWVTVPAAP